MTTDPRDVWAERSVLGAVLAAGAVPEILTSDLFWDPHHLSLFSACASMTASGEPCTPVTVRMEMLRRKQTGHVVDGVWLFEVMQAACMESQLSYLVGTLRELATRRQVIAACTRGLQAAENPSADVYDVAASVAVDMTTLADSTTPRALDAVPDIHEFLNGPEDYDWLIPGLLEKGDRLLITGGEGSGKSVLNRQLAVTAAAGVHPFTGVRTDPVQVLLVDLENPEKLLRRHLRGLTNHARSIGRPVPVGGLRIESHAPGIDLNSVTDRTWLEEKCRSVRPELLVIGPLYRMHASDMNSEEAARHLTRVIDGIRAEHGCSILMETHSPHGYQGARSLRPIGSSLFMRWPEFGYGLKARDGDTTNFQFLPWRGPRDEREFPDQLMRGGPEEWPWSPVRGPYVPSWGA